jgi:periplasmic protein TonB
MTLAISAALQCVAAGAMVLAPLAFTDHLSLKPDWAPRPRLRPYRPIQIFHEGESLHRPVVTAPANPRQLYAPARIVPISQMPQMQETLAPPAPDAMAAGDGTGVVGLPLSFDQGGPAGRGGGIPIPIPPPADPAAARHAAPAAAGPRANAPLRVGGDVQMAKLMRQPRPVYPVLAKSARVQGSVYLLGVIARDGTVQQLRVVSGHPLLVNSALEAVRQWVYQPTLLNGEPVEVIAPIEVHFVLQ